MPEQLTREIWEALSQPFGSDEVSFKPGAQGRDGKRLALPHIDARAVMTRLDTVVGPGKWSFDYAVMTGDCKKVKGILTVCGNHKADAGEAGPEDEPLKAAVSDCLKRCAVHFGIGRYIYEMPPIWVPYDEGKKRWTETPIIPPAALSQALRRCGLETDPVPERKERIKAAAEASPANRSPVAGIVGKPELTVVTQEGHAVDPATGEVKTDDGEARAADVALLQAFERAGLDPKLPGLMRQIACVALGRDVPVFRNLGPAPRREVAAWLDAHQMEAQGICTDVQAGLEKGQKAG